jgi:hypothetical protein
MLIVGVVISNSVWGIDLLIQLSNDTTFSYIRGLE